MATIRFDLAGDDAEKQLKEKAQLLAEAILAVRGVSSVHIGVSRNEVSSVRTRETELRKDMRETGFDVVILIEGSSSPGLQSALPEVERLALASGVLAGPVSNIYETAFSLTAEDMRARS